MLEKQGAGAHKSEIFNEFYLPPPDQFAPNAFPLYGSYGSKGLAGGSCKANHRTKFDGESGKRKAKNPP